MTLLLAGPYQKFIVHGSLLWGLPFGCGGLSHAGALLFHLVAINGVAAGLRVAPCFPLYTPTPSAGNGLIDVLTMASSFKAPAIPTYWSRPTVMCQSPGPVAVLLPLFLICPCFCLICRLHLEIESGQNFGVVGPNNFKSVVS